MGNPAATPQPAPLPGQIKVSELVVRDIVEADDAPLSAAANQVVIDLADREAMGTEKYGTALMTHNGRDALMDAYQEGLDLVMYLRQHHEETSPEVDYYEAPEYISALNLALRLRQLLNERVLEHG